MAINSLSSASKGLSGLASGMDTQQMVDAMLAGTKNKIDQAKQKKTQLSYKQELYRSLTAKLTSFSQTFFSYTSANTNLLSTAFFNSMKASTSSKAFTVTAGTNAATGKTIVDKIESLASKTTAKSTFDATGALSGKLDTAKLDELLKEYDKGVTIKVGDKSVSITMKELIGTDSAANGAFKMEDILNQKLQAEFGSTVKVKYTDGKMQLTSTGTAAGDKNVSITGDEKSLAVFGLSGEAKSDKGTLQFEVKTDAVMAGFTATVNGVKKNINVNLLAPTSSTDSTPRVVTQAELVDRLQKTMQSAFGAKVQVVENAGEIEFKMVNSGTNVNDRSSQITLTNPSTGTSLLGAMGISSGKSSKINIGMTLREANFSTQVVGDTQRFTINGVDFQFSSTDSIQEVMDQINRSSAGVTVSYQSTEDRFVIESNVSGKLNGDAFTISQSEGNVLTAMFGTKGSGALGGLAMGGSGSISEKDITVADDALPDAQYQVQLTVNGDSHTVTVKFEDGDTHDAETYVKRLNEAISKNEDIKGKVAFKAVKSDGKYTFSMATATDTTASVDSGMAFANLDGKEVYNGLAKADTKLSLMGLDQTEITFTKADGTTFSVTADASDTTESFRVKMENAVQTAAGSGAGVEFDEQRGAYRIFGVDIPMSMQVSGDEKKLFGTDEKVEVGATAAVAMDQKNGENAVAYINGTRIERSSNEFTVDGLTFELKDVTNDAGTIEVSRNVDQIYDGITKFVEEYNKIVDALNEQLDAKTNYKDYPPLTEEQKQSMSDREVELWEEKAKEGLLHSDSSVQNVLSSLRSTLYTKPEGGFALYDLGITTSYFSGKDKLQIEKPETLRQRISENPEAVQRLFTDTEKGLSTLLKGALDNATRTDPTNPGILVRQAGATGRTDTFSNIYREMKDLDERLSDLDRTYKSEYNRYWKQFNSMEQLIQQMNSQSAWLSQQFS